MQSLFGRCNQLQCFLAVQPEPHLVRPVRALIPEDPRLGAALLGMTIF
jgi:hypothetical protein